MFLILIWVTIFSTIALGCESREERIAREITNLKNEAPVKRAKAANYLGDEMVAEAVPALIRGLSDKGKIRKRAPLPLRGQGIEYLPETVQHRVAFALSQIGTPAVDPLVKLFQESDDPWERKGVIDALGYFSSDPRTFGPIIESIDDTDIDVRREAASLIGKIWPRAKTQEDQAKIRRAFERTLKDQSPFVRNAVLFSWVPSRIEENPLTDLIATALNDPNPDVRGQAADVLGEVKDPRSVERLIENLKEEANPDVRVRIVVALRKIGLKTAVPALQTQLDRETEQEVVDWIKKALESIDQKK